MKPPVGSLVTVKGRDADHWTIGEVIVSGVKEADGYYVVIESGFVECLEAIVRYLRPGPLESPLMLVRILD